GRQRAPHDLVGELQPQLLGPGNLFPRPRDPVDTLDHDPALAPFLRRATIRAEIAEAHVSATFGSSMMLTWAATILQPSGKRTQVCICRPTRPGALSR